MPKFLVQYYYYYEIFNYFIYSKNGNSTFNNTIFENNEGIEFSIWGSKFKTDFIESDNSNIFIYDSKFLNNMQLGTLFNCEETFSNVTIDNTSFIHNKENYQSTRKLNILNINNSNFISNEIGIQANIKYI